MSTMKNIMAKATVEEDFEQEFGIYDLLGSYEVLKSLSRIKLNFNGTANLKITDEG